MSRTGSLRFVMLMANNMTRLWTLRSYLSLCPSRRRVSSYNTNNASTALIPFQSQANNHHHHHSNHSAESNARNSQTQFSRSTNFSSSIGSLASIATARDLPSFGIAKDRSPPKRTRKDEIQREDPVIRHDAVYLKKCPNQSGVPDLQRKYKQTWQEFPQKRVRPVTEWGYYGPPKYFE